MEATARNKVLNPELALFCFLCAPPPITRGEVMVSRTLTAENRSRIRGRGE